MAKCCPCFFLLPHRLGVPRDLRRVLRHRIRQVAIDAARPVIRGMHARAGNRLVHVQQVFAFAERIKENGHRAHVQRVRLGRQRVDDAIHVCC